MPRFTMRRHGVEGWRITTGRRLAGNVHRAADGINWCARIGAHMAVHADPMDAFFECTAKALGFANHAALLEHNRQVRARNNAARRARAGSTTRRTRVFGPVEDEPYSA